MPRHSRKYTFLIFPRCLLVWAPKSEVGKEKEVANIGPTPFLTRFEHRPTLSTLIPQRFANVVI